MKTIIMRIDDILKLYKDDINIDGKKTDYYEVNGVISDEANDIIKDLSRYTDKIINADKSITQKDIPTDYFLKNNTWSTDFFYSLNQFKSQDNCGNKTFILFNINNTNLNNELKYIVYNKIFTESWGLHSIHFHAINIKRLCMFINEKYANVNSLTELEIKKVKIQWVDWLRNNNIQTSAKVKWIKDCKEEIKETLNTTAKYLENLINYFETLIDKREEWEKERWDIRNIGKKYNIRYSKSNGGNYIDFSKIQNNKLRKEVMKYMKVKLISQHNFGWGSACQYMAYIPVFLNFICDLEPTWNDLNNLERKHIEKYIEWLHQYANNLNKRNSNPLKYVRQVLMIIEKFLSDIQLREFDIAPQKNIKSIIISGDKPIVPRVSDNIQFVPDIVLEQLYSNINELPTEVIPIVYIMFKTGLRISDILELKQNCLIQLNNKYWIETDIKKVYVEGHKIPIDDELAAVIASKIKESEQYSNDDNNPNRYIFVRYTGSRKGYPYTRKYIQSSLNELAISRNIVDDSGNIYHFKNHSFRHTYAVKLMNNGVDVFTIQDLLAHSSPEMTITYAKLLDDTKRKVFDNAVKQGVFSFDERDKLKEENNGEIPSDIIAMLYTNHKLNALDTPYGTCMQRKNGKCNYAKQPPCLTCNNGSPCKDLCVGAFEGDIFKYEILINSTKMIIENAKIYNRSEMILENEELLNLYEDIYSKILEGNIIYSRIDKLKKKVN